jgi:3-hydroxyisobutyrate dehydrogenase-like beta-hydroxyacid dehydrogenase
MPGDPMSDATKSSGPIAFLGFGEALLAFLDSRRTKPGLQGALFFDCDSCAQQTKAGAAQEVEAAGGLYVDVAMMAPVHPRLHRTPLPISGQRGDAVAATLAALSTSVKIHGGPTDASSTVKMIRSIMMKGLVALVCECLLAGHGAGVIQTALASLDDIYSGFEWT